MPAVMPVSSSACSRMQEAGAQTASGQPTAKTCQTQEDDLSGRSAGTRPASTAAAYRGMPRKLPRKVHQATPSARHSG